MPLSMMALWKSPWSRRHTHQKTDLAPASGLPEDGYRIRVATKLRDVFFTYSSAATISSWLRLAECLNCSPHFSISKT